MGSDADLDGAELRQHHLISPSRTHNLPYWMMHLNHWIALREKSEDVLTGGALAAHALRDTDVEARGSSLANRRGAGRDRGDSRR